MRSWERRIAAELAEVRSSGQWRELRVFEPGRSAGTLAELESDGLPDSPASATGAALERVSFAGNDYLGLSRHPAVVEAAVSALRQWGAGATASRLVVGTRPVHRELEEGLAEWKNCRRAVLFPSGYHANLGVLTTLGGPQVTVLSDRLNHASIVDGCRLARSATAVFDHGDLDHLGHLLDQVEGPAVVVADSVFSMDGDEADVDGLARACAAHGDAILVLDEAHAVMGPTFDPGDLACDVVRVGTLSKALGAQGGYVAGSDALVDLLINRARSLIFTTGLAPVAAAAAGAALAVVRSHEGVELRARLRGLIDRLVPGHPSPVIPVLIGAEATAVAVASELAADGLLVPAIRPPTVAPGTSRLRVALSAVHTEAEVDRLAAALRAHGLSCGVPVGGSRR